jgi:hypothetical protein
VGLKGGGESCAVVCGVGYTLPAGYNIVVTYRERETR